MQERTVRILIGAALMTLWVVTLGLPVARSGNMATGAEILVIGWLGVVMLQFAWLGNFFFWLLLPVTVFVERPPRWLMWTGAALTLACGIDALFWTNIPTDANPGPITEYGPGYYLWIFSMLALAGWAALRAALPARVPDTMASNFS